MTKRGRGLFITFEGPDGCGKSTQMKMLAARLREAGKTVFETAEPGGPAAADAEEVLPQRVTGVTLPEQQPPEVGVPGEPDAHQVVHLALLEVTGPPDGHKGGEGDLVRTVPGTEADDHRAMLFRHRVEVVDDLEVPGLELLDLLLDDLVGSAGGIGHGFLDRLGDFLVGPVHARDVRAVIQLQFRVVPKESRHCGGMTESERKRVLGGGAGIRDQRDLAAGEPGEEAIADLLEGFHQAFSERMICGGCQTSR